MGKATKSLYSRKTLSFRRVSHQTFVQHVPDVPYRSGSRFVSSVYILSESSFIMPKEKADSEVKRLRKEQEKTRRDEVFGGLTNAERSEYERKSDRIHELESKISVKSAASAKAEQKLQWNRDSETDTPQGEAHQPYHSREKYSTDSSTESRRQRKPKKAPEEKRGE